jgi:chemotaxis signal transduction protein
MVSMASPRNEGQAPAQDADRLYLTCALAGERYLLPTGMVREVEEIGAITPVPATPSWLRGVMNLRGTIVPVIDLAHFLDLAPAPSSGGEALVCTTGDSARDNDDDLLVALAVEGVSNIRSFSTAEIVPLPEGQQSAGGTQHWAGFYRMPSRDGGAAELLGVLNLSAVLKALSLDEHENAGL